jgi:serine/threonine protein kinase
MNKLQASDPTSIGPYKVIERLGGGGMAEVFVVENPGLHGSFGRRLALKRILPSFQSNDSFRQQFADEAKLAGRLSHPSIVSFLDSGEHDGAYYLVMELVVGTDLGRLTRHLREEQSRLPMSLAIYVAQRVAAALAYAHPPPHSIVHRDVTPQNILLGMYGEVKLADFGIARHATRDRTKADHAKLKGKLPYMSPEQIAWPDSVDGRSDLFSLGIVLFELLTGTHPFLADLPDEQWEEQAVIWRMVQGEPAPRLLGVEPELSDLVARLLEREADLRPTTDETLRTLQDLPQRRVPEELLSKYIVTSVSHAASDVEVESTKSDSASQARAEVSETVHRGSRERALRATADVERVDRKSDPLRTVTIATSDLSAALHPVPSSVVPPNATNPWRRRLRSRGTLAAVGSLVLATGWVALSRSPSPQAPATLSVAPLLAPPSQPAPLTASSSLTSEPDEVPGESGVAREVEQESRAVAHHDVAAASSDPRPPATKTPTGDTVNEPPSDSKRVRSARLFVAVIPWGQVWVDGEARGEAPVTLEGLPAGYHRIQVGQGAPQKTFRVRLSPGANDFSYELEAAPDKAASAAPKWK